MGSSFEALDIGFGFLAPLFCPLAAMRVLLTTIRFFIGTLN
jgi:hypothetical protein